MAYVVYPQWRGAPRLENHTEAACPRTGPSRDVRNSAFRPPLRARPNPALPPQASPRSACSKVHMSAATSAERRAELLEVLKEVQDPDLGQDIVSLGFIKNVVFTPVDKEDPDSKYDVSFDVELTTPACPVKDQFQADCKRLAEGLGFVRLAAVTMTAMARKPADPSKAGALDNIGAIVAVASCKGGVGKSTAAVNLAFSLRARGAKVGIMDADIYGPSLPTMVRPDNEAVEFVNGRIKPLYAHGVKLMSFGYINPESAIMRGPMIANMLNQILTTTEWGDLDYLVLDMPPGTGDVQLTLSQILNITAAVIVTTPQKLSFVDVVKGIDMFNKVEVPSIAVVENMSYFVAPESGVKHHIFGPGHRTRLQEQYGISNAFSMPIEPEISEKGDEGVPYVVSNPESAAADEYGQLAGSVVQEVSKILFGGLRAPGVVFDDESGEIIVTVNDTLPEQRIWPATLRRQCRCALCIDEMSGAQKLDPKSVSESIKPLQMTPVGNYALQVNWSDNHESLYPYRSFVDDWPAPSPTLVETSEVEAEEPVSAPAH